MDSVTRVTTTTFCVCFVASLCLTRTARRVGSRWRSYSRSTTHRERGERSSCDGRISATLPEPMSKSGWQRTAESSIGRSFESNRFPLSKARVVSEHRTGLVLITPGDGTASASSTRNAGTSSPGCAWPPLKYTHELCQERFNFHPSQRGHFYPCNSGDISIRC